MLWVYVLVTTAGLVAIVPTVLRALDGMAHDLIAGVIGFFGTSAGLTGLFCRQVGIGGWITLAASGAIGLAAAALHPELLSVMRGEGLSSSTTSGNTTSTSTSDKS